jgi:undecaprenyl diphosphate synthase
LTSDHYFKQRLNDAVRLTYNNQAGVFNFAYNYGGRAEIIHATRQLLAEGVPSDNLLEQKLESHLWTAGLSNVDLVIRTGGDLRLSNFMLWQSAHACLHVVQHYWPAITGQDIEAGIQYFNQVVAPTM